MKSKLPQIFTVRFLIREAPPFLLAYFTLQLFRVWLGIQSAVFDCHVGWKPFLAWILIFGVFESSYCRLLYQFGLRDTPRLGYCRANPAPDVYGIVQKEMAEERAQNIASEKPPVASPVQVSES